MIKVVVAGAAGRMGKQLVANIAAADDMELFGALEYPGSPLLGQDAGLVAGVGACGVKISAEPEKVIPGADAVINFATGGVIEVVRLAVANNACAVVGTTALTPEVKAEFATLAEKGGRIVAAGNMSVGVNLLYKLAKEATLKLGDEYDVEIVEMHHNQKKDAPSGTAVRLAEVICEARDWKYDEDVRHGRQGQIGKRPRKEIGMHSLRGGDVVGDHTVIFAVNGERVELTHKASSRDTFARGALRAVRFLSDAPAGLYDMQDVLGLK